MPHVCTQNTTRLKAGLQRAPLKTQHSGLDFPCSRTNSVLKLFSDFPHIVSHVDQTFPHSPDKRLAISCC